MSGELSAVHGEIIDLVVFTVDSVICALRVDEVHEIKRLVHITRVHRSAGYVRGVVNLRGEIVTLIDLCSKLNYRIGELCDNSRMVVVKKGSEQIGLLVDTIEDAVSARNEDILAPPSTIRGAEGRFFKGVYKTPDALIAVLDMEALLEKDGNDVSLSSE